MSTPTKSLNESSTPEEPRRVSDKCYSLVPAIDHCTYFSMYPSICASDADLIFASCDNVLFHIHHKNLEPNTTGFPPTEFDTRGEIVPLTEDAGTLELLFRYVYPQRHPNLVNIPFSTLAPLAEAAEKYQVFAAMNICCIRMKDVLPDHAVEIFNYASKHDYADILDEAAPFLLDVPVDDIVKTLAAYLVIPWVCYRKAWSRAAFKAISTLPAKRKNYCDNCGDSIPYSDHGHAWLSLGEKRSRAALNELLTKSAYAQPDQQACRERLEEELRKVPGFATFL